MSLITFIAAGVLHDTAASLWCLRSKIRALHGVHVVTPERRILRYTSQILLLMLNRMCPLAEKQTHRWCPGPPCSLRTPRHFHSRCTCRASAGGWLAKCPAARPSCSSGDINRRSSEPPRDPGWPDECALCLGEESVRCYRLYGVTFPPETSSSGGSRCKTSSKRLPSLSSDTTNKTYLLKQLILQLTKNQWSMNCPADVYRNLPLFLSKNNILWKMNNPYMVWITLTINIYCLILEGTQDSGGSFQNWDCGFLSRLFTVGFDQRSRRHWIMENVVHQPSSWMKSLCEVITDK